MPRDAVSRTVHVGTWLRKSNGGHKWVKTRLLWNFRAVSLVICVAVLELFLFQGHVDAELHFLLLLFVSVELIPAVF